MTLTKIKKARNSYEGSVIIVDVKAQRKIARIQLKTAQTWGIIGCRSVTPFSDDGDPNLLYLQFRKDKEGTYLLTSSASTYWFACAGIIRHYSLDPQGIRKKDTPFSEDESTAFRGIREKGGFIRINLQDKVIPT
jgi:hypothetical protein